MLGRRFSCGKCVCWMCDWVRGDEWASSGVRREQMSDLCEWMRDRGSAAGVSFE